jgi:ATP-dependent RNA circularization protein (DNA/RNA ligase family)
MEYPKINSLWNREGFFFDIGKHALKAQKTGALITGAYSEPEFAVIKKWRLDEKIDGTNIRVIYQHGKVGFGGRTKDAQIPCHLFEMLHSHFHHDLMRRVFPGVEEKSYPNVFLFGEGYGPKIQAGGGNYRKDAGFILFDVIIGDWWLKREDVKSLADELGVPMVPDLGVMSEEEAIEFVKSKPLSRCSHFPQVMEGIVARSEPLMLFRKRLPIMWKLKVRDFV